MQRKSELVQRTNMVAQGLASIGVRAAVLKTQEVIELFYGCYNIDESQSQNLVNTQEMTVPVVDRNGGNPRPYNAPPKEQEPADLYAAARQQQQVANPQNIRLVLRGEGKAMVDALGTIDKETDAIVV